MANETELKAKIEELELRLRQADQELQARRQGDDVIRLPNGDLYRMGLHDTKPDTLTLQRVAPSGDAKAAVAQAVSKAVGGQATTGLATQHVAEQMFSGE